jgi:hypothetical protein
VVKTNGFVKISKQIKINKNIRNTIIAHRKNKHKSIQVYFFHQEVQTSDKLTFFTSISSVVSFSRPGSQGAWWIIAASNQQLSPVTLQIVLLKHLLQGICLSAAFPTMRRRICIQF